MIPRSVRTGLRKGEMVHADGFTMFDSMSAIQVSRPAEIPLYDAGLFP